MKLSTSSISQLNSLEDDLEVFFQVPVRCKISSEIVPGWRKPTNRTPKVPSGFTTELQKVAEFWRNVIGIHSFSLLHIRRANGERKEVVGISYLE